MKSERNSFRRSVQSSRGRIPGKGGRTKVARGPSSHAIDQEKLLHFSQQLYAHALTLQEVIRTEGEAAYEDLRPRYDRQAAQQFEIFYPPSERLSGFRKRDAGRVNSGLNQEA
jgi:hypothetical protein